MTFQKATVLASLIAGSVLGAVPGAASAAAPATTSTVSLVAGSASYLVYSVNAPHTASKFYARDSSGRAVRLPGATGGRWSVVGHVATTTAPANDAHVLWFDLGRQTHGSVDLTAGTSYIGAAPNGWVTESSTGTFLRHSMSGHTSSLGRPYAGVASGTSGAHGVVAVQGSRKASYLLWSKPGHPRTLHPGLRAGETLACLTVGSDIAACMAITATGDPADPDETYRALDMPLTGTHTVAAAAGLNVISPSAVGHSMAWLDTSGRLHHLAANGATGHATGHGPHTPVGAFGRLIGTDRHQTRVLSMTVAGTHRHVLFTTS